jgi:PPM family protein phosphatase
MKDVLVSVFADSNVGMHRTGNEDAFLVADLTTGIGASPEGLNSQPLGERGSLFVVSDGMGGAAAGEVASEMAVETIRDSLMSSPREQSAIEKLKRATEAANDRIWDHARANPELLGMGATVTAVIAQGKSAYLGQVGDSRAYLIRGDRIKQLTRDQSLVQLLVDSGAIQPEQAGAVPQNVIMQALGTQPILKVVLTEVALCRKDHLLICSDGLSNKLKPEEMLAHIRQESDLSSICRKLIEIANERGGEDNITVIVARFDGDGLDDPPENSRITGSVRSMSDSYTHEAIPGSGGAELASTINEDAGAGIPQKPSTGEAAKSPETPTTPELEPTRESADSASSNVEFSFKRRPARQRIGYGPILVTALISLLLVAAVSYFFYTFYLRHAILDEAPTGSSPANR